MSQNYIIPETEADDTLHNFTSRTHRPAHYNTHEQAENTVNNPRLEVAGL